MKLAATALVLASACTTLGPMPATTGVSAIPANRPGSELQAGIMPAFFLSDATKKTPRGNLTSQLSYLVEPDRLLGTKGLVLGVRSWGEDQDGAIEPMIGYRRRFDENGSLAVIGYGTRLSGENNGASYRGSHLGGELAVDGKLLGNQWFAVHAQASGSLTYLSAAGSYCVGPSGGGTDCDRDSDSDSERDHHVQANLTGLFPAATASFTFDFARRPTGIIHGVRLAFLTTYGSMPVIHYPDAYAATPYTSFGLSLTLGLGADR